jgi:hypothetical protein
MANVTFTGVAIPDNKSNMSCRVAGGTIAKHDVVYIDTSDSNSVKPADASASASAYAYGLALHGASDGEYVLVATNGATVTVGGGLTANTRYVVGGDAGKIEPQSGLSGGEYICELGYANSTTELYIDIYYTGNTA